MAIITHPSGSLPNYDWLIMLPSWICLPVFNSRRRRGTWQGERERWGQGTMENSHIQIAFVSQFRGMCLLCALDHSRISFGDPAVSQPVAAGTLSICKHDKNSFIRQQPWPAYCPQTWNCHLWRKIAWCLWYDMNRFSLQRVKGRVLLLGLQLGLLDAFQCWWIYNSQIWM